MVKFECFFWIMFIPFKHLHLCILHKLLSKAAYDAFRVHLIGLCVIPVIQTYDLGIASATVYQYSCRNQE